MPWNRESVPEPDGGSGDRSGLYDSGDAKRRINESDL